MRVPLIMIACSAAETIWGESPASADGNETGGILLGHDHGDQITVTVAGDPGPAAIRKPREFLRDLARARSLADAAYDHDGSVWLGEWHTHPTGPTQPSPRDLTTYARLLADDRLDFNRLLSVIVTPCPHEFWGHLHVHSYTIAPLPGAAHTLTVTSCQTHVERGSP